MAIRLILAVLFLLTLLPAGPSHAAEEVEPSRKVSLTLMADHAVIAPGQSFWIALKQDMIPHWHTYWRNPGDSGLPTEIDWQLPEGFEAGPTLWQTPERIPFGPMINFGYENEAYFLVNITAPPDIEADQVTLSADSEWLVCKETCIPESGSARLTLETGQKPVESAQADEIRTSRTRLPQDVEWPAAFHEKGGQFILDIRLPESLAEQFKPNSVALFPRAWGMAENAAEAAAKITGDNILRIVKPRASRPFADIRDTHFVIAYTDPQGQRQAARVEGRVEGNQGQFAADTDISSSPVGARQQGGIAVWQALIFALLGGVILNLMPCVFPILSMKALSVAKLSGQAPSAARWYGLAYTAGILVTFGIIAGLLLALKAGGSQIGWGFQLQNPAVVTALALLLFLIGLNLAGLFEIGGRFTGWGSRLTGGQGIGASFFTGVLATLVATPCTAPFMGVALGFALTQPATVAMAVFLALGFGLALPYLLLTFIPALRNTLPRPGPWMDIFKQFLAFPMFATAVWLVWVLAQQTGPDGIAAVMGGMTALAFSIWLFRHRPRTRTARFLTTLLGLLSLLGALGTIPMVSALQTLPAGQSGEQSGRTQKGAAGHDWQPFERTRLRETLQSQPQKPVFVEMTASWCITCQVNQRSSIATDKVRKAFDAYNVIYFIGDWTNRDSSITAYLEDFGRSGVPLYVYYPPAPGPDGDRPEPKVLPQILTPGLILETLQQYEVK